MVGPATGVCQKYKTQLFDQRRFAAAMCTILGISTGSNYCLWAIHFLLNILKKCFINFSTAKVSVYFFGSRTVMNTEETP